MKNDNYEDIINLPRPEPIHKRMSIYNRAAQFAPFAALVGYSNEVLETTRLTDEKIELTDEEIDKLNNKMNLLKNNNSCKVKVIYFEKDKIKSGGEYKSIIGNIKKIEINSKAIFINDNIKIMFNDILDINILT